MDIDKLNNLETQVKKKKSIDIDEYFDAMDLTKAQIQERKAFAEETEDLLFIIYDYILDQYKYNSVNYDSVKRELVDGYQKIVDKYIALDDDLRSYIQTFADDVIDTTKKHLSAIDTSPDVDIADSYWLSNERATDTACNMALDVINYKDFITAKERGFTRKQWLAIEDKKTRPSHSIVNETIIPIDEYFEVGVARLAYPHDTVTKGSTGAEHLEEISNCRCGFRYVR